VRRNSCGHFCGDAADVECLVRSAALPPTSQQMRKPRTSMAGAAAAAAVAPWVALVVTTNVFQDCRDYCAAHFYHLRYATLPCHTLAIMNSLMAGHWPGLVALDRAHKSTGGHQLCTHEATDRVSTKLYVHNHTQNKTFARYATLAGGGGGGCRRGVELEAAEAVVGELGPVGGRLVLPPGEVPVPPAPTLPVQQPRQRRQALPRRRAPEEDDRHPRPRAAHHHPVPHAPEPPVRQHLFICRHQHGSQFRYYERIRLLEQ
jgi:hypothetical protein